MSVMAFIQLYLSIVIARFVIKIIMVIMFLGVKRICNHSVHMYICFEIDWFNYCNVALSVFFILVNHQWEVMFAVCVTIAITLSPEFDIPLSLFTFNWASDNE